MKAIVLVLMASILLGSVVLLAQKTGTNEEEGVKKLTQNTYQDFYDLTYTSIDGKTVSMSTYRGKALVIVNVASKCGFTGQYEDLEKLYDDYKDKGLVVIGFPTNDFGGQEPGSNEDIKEFCSLTYGVSFPMSVKISVKNPKHPIFAHLSNPNTNKSEAKNPSWNFNKYIINREGKLVKHFSSMTNPSSDKFRNVIDSVI